MSAISEELLSLAEQISSLGTGVQRVHNSIEMVDYIANLEEPGLTPCYALEMVPQDRKAALASESASLNSLIEELKIVSPDFIQVETFQLFPTE